jgi:pyridinium-3,5-bisthiocarboxylic acid mononucleotide nickel chelatase
MTIAFFDCYAGASGDMFLGAWLDVGIDRQAWRDMLNQLKVDGYDLDIRTVYKNGIRATKVDVNLHPVADSLTKPHHPHRHLADIEQILLASGLPKPVLEKSRQAFRCLAEAEGEVHGTSPEQVHFHEVGAVDAIVDVVGAMAGWYLAGMPTCYVSAIEVGSGTVHCDHGLMPVPAPATATLMHGFVTYSSGFQGETLTPTGAAILKVLCSDGRRPLMVTERSGYGAGTKDFPVANVLRIQLGEAVVDELNGLHPSTQTTAAAMNSESACVLEANIDDMNPEWAAYVVHQLLELGAMDAWLTPIVMKKGRPGLQLHVLCNMALRDRVIQQIHLETTTIGVRHYEVSRSVLPREVLPVDTPYGVIRVKVAYQDERVVNVAPEFEDCRLCAEDRGVPLKEVYAAAMAAYRQRV